MFLQRVGFLLHMRPLQRDAVRLAPEPALFCCQFLLCLRPRLLVDRALIVVVG